MARHIILNNNFFYKICETDEDKNFYENLGYESKSITEDQFLKLKKSKTTVSKNNENNLVWSDSVDDPNYAGPYFNKTKDEIIENLKSFIKLVEHHIQNNMNVPANYSNDLVTLNTLLSNIENDSAGITYNVEGRAEGDSWTDCLYIAGQTVPLWLVI